MSEVEEHFDTQADPVGERGSDNGSPPFDGFANEPPTDPPGNAERSPDQTEDEQESQVDEEDATGDADASPGHQNGSRHRRISTSSRGSQETLRTPRRTIPNSPFGQLTEDQVQTFKKLRVASSNAEDLIEAYTGKTVVGTRLTELKLKIDKTSSILSDCYEGLVDLKIRELAPILARSGTFKRKLARLTASLEEKEGSNVPSTASVPAPSAATTQSPTKNTEALLSASEHELRVYLERLKVNLLPDSVDLKDAETLKMTADVDLPQIKKYIEECKKSLMRYANIPGAQPKLIDLAQRRWENALEWTEALTRRYREEKLNLEVRQQAREVNFVPWKPGGGQQYL